MDAENILDIMSDLLMETLSLRLQEVCETKYKSDYWDLDLLSEVAYTEWKMHSGEVRLIIEKGLTVEEVVSEFHEIIWNEFHHKYLDFKREYGNKSNQLLKELIFTSMDDHWSAHVRLMDAIRRSVHLNVYAQKKPIDEYKNMAFELYKNLLKNIKVEVAQKITDF